MWLPLLRAAVLASWLSRCCVVMVMAAGGSSVIEEDGIRSIPLRTHSLNHPYLDSDMQSRWFDFGGNTIVRADQYIRLTSDRPSQDGWVFSRVPLTATNWEIEFTFRIHGASHLHGDGFAMWLTKSRGTSGPVFGSTDNFEGLGIFFDTYKNNRPGTVFPYVMAMIGDGQTAYDKYADGKANEFAGCSAREIRDAAIPTKARLRYFQDKQLKLELQYKSEDAWELCFETTTPPLIPSVSYLGFSAETGELSDNHDIISINTRNLYNTNSNAQRGVGDGKGVTLPMGKPGAIDGSDPVPPQGSGWAWFFLKAFLGCAVLSAGYVGFTAYRAQRKRGSRF